MSRDALVKNLRWAVTEADYEDEYYWSELFRDAANEIDQLERELTELREAYSHSEWLRTRSHTTAFKGWE